MYFYFTCIVKYKNMEDYDQEAGDYQLFRCVICGFFMGPNNPRQYCRKTWCPKMFEEYSELDLEMASAPKFKHVAVQTSD